MNKHTPPQPPATLVNLPATTSKAKPARAMLASVSEIKRFTALCDNLLERYQQIGHSNDESDYVLDEYIIAQIAEAKQQREKLDPPQLYEDDVRDEGCPRPEIIAARLAMLLASFPTSAGPAEPKGFAAQLLEHVVAEFAGGLSNLALATACMEIETGRASVPPIQVVLETLKRHDEEWGYRLTAVYELKGTAVNTAKYLKIKRAQAALAKSEEMLQRTRRLRDDSRFDLIRKQDEARKLAEEIARMFDNDFRLVEDSIYWAAHREDAARELEALAAKQAAADKKEGVHE